MRFLAVALAVLMSVSVARADTVALPDGCYVDFSNPSVCFNPSGMTALSWTEYDFAGLFSHYGAAMAIVITANSEMRTLRDQCQTSYDGVVAQYNTLVDNFNSLNALNKSNIKLIKKLRSACGKKCKKIR